MNRENGNSSILVVDDMTFNLEVMEGILYREGYHVITASNADEAAVIIKERILHHLDELDKLGPDELIDQRIEKYGKMGFFKES